MPNQIKEGILHTLFFFLAIGILLCNSIGILTIPGIIVALIAIYFAYKQNYYIPAVFGLIAASVSFTGQYITAFCPYCTAAAFCFFIGGMLSLRHIFTKILPLSVGLLIIMTSSLTLYSTAPVVDARTTEIISSKPILSVTVTENKPLLFLSPSCKSCKETMKERVKADSTGKTWQPVIIPHSALQTGKTMLEENGYKGKTISADKAPGRAVPVLSVKGDLYTGAKAIKTYYEGGKKVNANT